MDGKCVSKKISINCPPFRFQKNRKCYYLIERNNLNNIPDDILVNQIIKGKCE